MILPSLWTESLYQAAVKYHVSTQLNRKLSIYGDDMHGLALLVFCNVIIMKTIN